MKKKLEKQQMLFKGVVINKEIWFKFVRHEKLGFPAQKHCITEEKANQITTILNNDPQTKSNKSCVWNGGTAAISGKLSLKDENKKMLCKKSRLKK